METDKEQGAAENVSSSVLRCELVLAINIPYTLQQAHRTGGVSWKAEGIASHSWRVMLLFGRPSLISTITGPPNLVSLY
jgi:hypothetical protein